MVSRDHGKTGLARIAAAIVILCGGVIALADSAPKPEAALPLKMRVRVETSKGSDRFHTVIRPEQWNPLKTAVIVCDVWDLHHCLNAVRRAEEFAPRLNRFLIEARKRGMTVIHAPSDCMNAYKDHQSRKRTMVVPRAKKLPKDIGTWCSRIPAEEKGRYPIDQSDGGEDDDPAEHKAWAKKLEKMGRNPRAPWKKQSAALNIEAKDYVSDKGDEIWSILNHHGIDNVILTGVHTNMCVLGRPFGLRQMVKNGKNAVLVRDLTDTMYNPLRWPYVSHFSGTDLIVEHIEKYVCPTITSDQLLGDKPFRFKLDKRPHLALVMAEDEYASEKILPVFATRFFGKDFRVSTVFANAKDPNDLPGLEVLDEAELLILSARRRVLKPGQLEIFRRFVKAKKPVIGIRTASHAFTPMDGKVPKGRAAWPEFDRQVFGGNYQGHHGNKDASDPRTNVRVMAEARKSPLLTGVGQREFVVSSWLYKTAPLAKGTTVLMMGRVAQRKPQQPVAWTYSRADGGKSFYTSLGHPLDFALADVQRLFVNAVYWSAGLPIPKQLPGETGKKFFQAHWNPVSVPSTVGESTRGLLGKWTGTAWYRCLIQLPKSWAGKGAILVLWAAPGSVDVFLNGNKLKASAMILTEEKNRSRTVFMYSVDSDTVEFGELNLLAVRIEGDINSGLVGLPHVSQDEKKIDLRGRWQFRVGDDPLWVRYALPAKFAAPTDVIFQERRKR